MSFRLKLSNISLCVVFSLCFYAAPINAEELSFEMSDTFGMVENTQNYVTPPVSGQGRIKFYNSNDGQWDAGLGVAMIEPAAGEETSINSKSDALNPTPFLNIKYKFKSKN